MELSHHRHNVVLFTPIQLHFKFIMLLLLIIISSSIHLQPTMSKPHNNYTDLESLLAFKSSVSDPNGLLKTNWITNNTYSFCNWIGVYCNNPTRQRVVGLKLENVFLHGTLSPHLGNLSFLSRLHLGNNNLTGPIPDTLGRLPRLSNLTLYFNYLSGQIPSTIFNMSSLKHIDVLFNNLTGPLPSSNIINLPSLQILSLSKNQLTGHIPSALGRCSSLQVLSLSFNQFSGTIPSELGNITGLSVLYIGLNQLSGTIPTSIGNLTNLTELDLASNFIQGVIPEELGNLSNLQFLNLGFNNLTGKIPTSLLNCTKLNFIQLIQNDLSGPIPSSIGEAWPHLTYFNVAQNQLSGTIPSSLGLCSSLQKIYLSHNQFSGTIPPELGDITALSELSIGADPQSSGTSSLISGTIPNSIGKLTNLRELDLGFTSIQGVIPEELGNLSNLQRLNLALNNLTGPIPTSLLNCTNLKIIQLAYNDLTGPIPASIGEAWPHLKYFNVNKNQLSGGLDFITSLTNCKDLQTIDSSNNPLDGALPNAIGNLSANLLYFELESSHIRGKIPVGFGNLSSLLRLDLSANHLTGQLPSDLSRLQNLQGIYLRQNAINGIIPFELGIMTSLIDIYLDGNVLSGSIPDSIGNISGLQHLSLADNKLSSSIPDTLWSLKSLIVIVFSQNTLQGLLPMQMGNSKGSLDVLDLSNNRLSGNISTALGDLQMLEYLDLSYNAFHNEIPQSLGGLINIQYLNLSHNVLSGSIPKSLANLSHLTSLDLSFNKLEGPIPQGRVFSNASIPSLEGNADLCGAPQLHYATCFSIVTPSNAKSKVYLLRYILPPIAFVVVLGFFCFYLFLRLRPRSIKEKIPSEEDAYLSKLGMISYQELVRATNDFNITNLLGKGSFSSVFKGYLNDGLVVAVKVLNLETRGAMKSFGAECYALSMLRHRNLVKIISVCSNLEFKALIFHFMPNGNLDQLLHAHNYYLNLLQRIDIMVDVSLAMEYLHHDHPEIIVHCDLKPSNVLFDENMVAHVGDFGIAKMLLGDGNSMMSASTPGTIGYIAPEYGSTGKISKKGDVYSFGILLLETFTRRRPSDAMFEGGLSLRQWVSDAYPDAMLKIIDDNLLREEGITQRQPEDQTIIHQCLSSLIELGLICSSYLPKERISMRDVVPKLQKIKREYLSMLPSA